MGLGTLFLGPVVNNLTVGVICAQKLFRKALFHLLVALSLGSGLSFVVDSDTVDDASQQITTCAPDVLLIDCDGLADCFRTIRKVRELSPSTKSLLLTGVPDNAFAVQAVRSGAWGLVAKQSEPALLQQAIQTIVKGEMWFSHGTMVNALQAFVNHEPPEGLLLEKLTSREAEVLSLLAKGYHNKEIARRLFLSENTVRRYAESIYRKLGVNSRVEAALCYQAHSNHATQSTLNSA